MLNEFIGRKKQLVAIDQFIQTQQGGVFAVKGTTGMGKSTLLVHVSEQYQDKAQVFVDINDLPPMQTAVEFLKFLAEHAHGLKQTKKALAKINGTYQTTADLVKPYAEVLKETGQFIAEVDEGITPEEKSKLSSTVSILWKLGVVLWKRKQETDKASLGDPELYLLTALKKDCSRHPLIFIDTYECLQASKELNQQKISSLYSRLHEQLSSSKATLSIQDWVERFILFMQESGALILLAGCNTGYWQTQAQNLDRFDDQEILRVVSSIHQADLQNLAEEQPQALLTVLKRLSFDGIPLWLQLGVNFVDNQLKEGKSISMLAAMENIDNVFATPIIDDDLKSANIDHANCKLALFNRVMQHNLDIADKAWYIALPRRLDKGILKVIFENEVDLIRAAFVKAGLLPPIRIVNEDNVFRLHSEIRDLLLANARYKGWLESKECQALQKKLADFFTQQYEQNKQISYFLEKLYHQLMLEDDANLEGISNPSTLLKMALDLQDERQYVKMSHVCLRLIEIQSEHYDAYYGLGIALNNQGKHDEAIEAYRRQVEVTPDHEWAWNNLDIAFMKQGYLSQAQEAYVQSLKLKPNDLSLLTNDAELALIQQDIQRCQQRVEQALDVADRNQQEYTILPFLAWLALPTNSIDPVINAIQQRDKNVTITWDFSDIEPVIERLNFEHQSIARKVIDYLNGSLDDLSGFLNP